MLDNIKSDDKSLGMKDVRALIVSTIASGPTVPWADIRLQSRIQHVVLVVLDSLSLDLYLDAAASGCMPYLSSSFQFAASKAPGSATRVFDGQSVLLRHPMSKSALKNLKKEHNMALAALSPKKHAASESEMDVTDEDGAAIENGSVQTSNSTQRSNIGPAKTREELEQRKDMGVSLAEKSLFSEKTEVSPGQLILTDRELEANLYPLPHNIVEPGFIEIPRYKESSNSDGVYHILGVDCEMCRTTSGIELTRVVVVNVDLEVVYDSYVRPVAKITDYLTRYSGIAASDLDGVSVRLEDVQRDLLKFITPKTILVGHSLENDLKALKLSHFRVVDTALLYPHTRGETFKNSLKYLAENWLNESIQNDAERIGHDPTQDACTALKLALLKFKSHPGFGRIHLADKEENLCEFLYRSGKRTSITDNAHSCKNYAGSHTDLNAEESDDIITAKASKAIQSCKYEFVYARLRDLERYYISLEVAAIPTETAQTPSKDNVQSSSAGENAKEEKEKDEKVDAIATPASVDDHAAVVTLEKISEKANPDREIERNICAKLDEHLRQMLASTPKRTLIVVTGGHGNLARTRTITSMKRKIQTAGGAWSEIDDAKSRAIFEKARETVSFFRIPPLSPDDASQSPSSSTSS